MEETDIKIDPRTMAIVLSDVHLGALETERSFFNEFLGNLISCIESNEYENLRALIVLGDCFDLIMDTHKDMFENRLYREIFDKFETLHKNPKFRLVFALGNHEVPVGDKNPEFSKYKTEMLNNFKSVQKEMNINYSFFTEEIFAQYILLQGFELPKLKLFNTVKDLEKDNLVEEFELGVDAETKEFKNYFMAHGYQFDPNLEKFAGVWDLGLRGGISFVKQVGDVIWHCFLKKLYDKGKNLYYSLEKKKNKFIKKAKKFTKKFLKKHNVDLKPNEKPHLVKEVDQRCESELHREAIRMNQGSIDNIVSYIPNLDIIVPIDHVLYGHTHKRFEEDEREYLIRKRPESNQMQVEIEYEGHTYYISNPGAWQHTRKPSFIEIRTDWKVEMNKVKKELKYEVIVERKIPTREGETYKLAY